MHFRGGEVSGSAVQGEREGRRWERGEKATGVVGGNFFLLFSLGREIRKLFCRTCPAERIFLKILLDIVQQRVILLDIIQ